MTDNNSTKKTEVEIVSLAVVMLRLGLSTTIVAKLFDFKNDKLRSLLAKNGLANMRQIPGWTFGSSKKSDCVKREIGLYLESFEKNVEIDKISPALFEEFRRLLIQGRGMVVEKPKKSYLPRNVPLAVIRRLRAHGLSSKTIADITGFNFGTIRFVLKKLEVGAVQPLPESEVSGFASVLMEYAELICSGNSTAGSIEEDIQDAGWYLRVLKKYLKVEELLAYLLAMEETSRHFQTIGRTPTQESYVRLFVALTGLDLAEKVSATHMVTCLWESYLRRLHDGKVEIIPQSVMELRLVLAKEILPTNRGSIWPDWTNEMSALLKKALDRLSYRNQTIVQMLFGFNGRVIGLSEIAKRLGFSCERIRQCRIKAFISIRQTGEYQQLKRLMLPVDQLAKELAENDKKVAQLEAMLESARETIDVLMAEKVGIKYSLNTEVPVEGDENLLKRVEELELSVRSAHCLQNAGIEFIYQLVEKDEAEMLKTKNFGRKSLNEIKEILAEMGLQLGMKLKKPVTSS